MRDLELYTRSSVSTNCSPGLERKPRSRRRCGLSSAGFSAACAIVSFTTWPGRRGDRRVAYRPEQSPCYAVSAARGDNCSTRLTGPHSNPDGDTYVLLNGAFGAPSSTTMSRSTSTITGCRTALREARITATTSSCRKGKGSPPICAPGTMFSAGVADKAMSAHVLLITPVQLPGVPLPCIKKVETQTGLTSTRASSH